MIYILYSSDYEVFLGENYLPENQVLIEPTERLLDLCGATGIPMTLFCDVASIWRYRESGMSDFPGQMEHQLRNAAACGHDVQTHLHPHWFFAQREGNNWVYDTSKYLMGNVSGDPEEIYALAAKYLKRMADYLEALIRPVAPSYKCVAFRAGGYGMQPRENILISALESTGYLIDSSIVPAMVRHSNVNQIDFSQVPSASNYFISHKTGLGEAADGLFEIPIAACFLSYPRSFKYNIIAILNWLAGSIKKSHPRGASIQMAGQDSKNNNMLRILKLIYKYSFNMLKNRWDYLELSANYQLMFDITKRYVSQYVNKKKDIIFSFSCHPKTIDENKLKALIKYQLMLKQHFGENIKAISFQDVIKHKLIYCA